MAEIEKPLPAPDDETSPFWGYCKQRVLCMQKCVDCGYIRWPPTMFCPKCHSKETEWTVLTGKGKVYTYTVFNYVYHPAFAQDVPYTIASIELDEGPRIMSRIADCKPEDVEIDMPVKVKWERVSDEFNLPTFRPVEQARQKTGESS